MKTLRVLPEAEAEIEASALWYESKRTGLGAEFLAMIDEAFEDIVDAPQSVQLWREGAPWRIAHALGGCEVRIAVAVGGSLAVHRVRIRAGQAQAAADPEMPSWLKGPHVERLPAHGTVADLVHKLDQLAAKSIAVAQLD